MSRQTVTITTPTGAKVRTTTGKRFYIVVVSYDHDQSCFVAKVIKRTDDVVVADRTVRNIPGASCYVIRTLDGVLTPGRLAADTLAARAASEKDRRKFAARIGTQGDARRLAY